MRDSNQIPQSPSLHLPALLPALLPATLAALVLGAAPGCVDEPSEDGGTTRSDIDTGDDDAEGSSPEDWCLPCEAQPGSEDPYADCVPVFEPAPATASAGGWNHDQVPSIVLGPPGGALDTVSLGCGGVIVLGFAGAGIVDGPGPDLIVFENPFNLSFPEAMQVEVSVDGCSWARFDCDPLSLEGCAGVTPVAATPGSDIDPTDPDLAGGDAFDLALVGLDSAHFVRLTDVSEVFWTGQFCDPSQAGKGGADLDALARVH